MAGKDKFTPKAWAGPAPACIHADPRRKIMARPTVQCHTKVKEGTKLFAWDPYTDLMVNTRKGEVQFVDIERGRTLKEETDEKGRRQAVITDDLQKELSIEHV